MIKGNQYCIMIKTTPISYLNEISYEEDKDGKITIERIKTSFYIKNSQNFTLSCAIKIKEALERYYKDKGIMSDELKISIGQLTITEIEQYNECEKDIDRFN